jgi:hypothetical protein
MLIFLLLFSFFFVTVFGSASAFTHDGYDSAMGTNAICWKSRAIKYDDNEIIQGGLPNPLVNGTHVSLQRPSIIEDCRASLTLHPPTELSRGERLRTDVEYEYTVKLDLDLRHLLLGVDGGGEDLVTDDLGRSVRVQLLFCAIGRTGFCSPFVPDEALAHAAQNRNIGETDTSMIMHDGVMPAMTHIDSGWEFFPNLGSGGDTQLQRNINIWTSIERKGEYFVIASLQFFTFTANMTNTTNPQVSYRWDIANALRPGADIGRVVEYNDPPVITEVSEGILIFSNCAIGVSSLCILFLIYQTIKHRKAQVLNLSQVDFLVVFLVSALIATVSAFLLQPKNDLYCQIRLPMILIPIQVMYSITLGRLWRISAVISPLLLEHYRKSMKHNVWQARLVRWFARIRCGDKKQGLRRTVSSTRLALVVVCFAFPQVVFQACSAWLQPQHRVTDLNEDESLGRARCSNGMSPSKSILNYGIAALVVLILTLLVMAFSSRKLPSLFNETAIIYSTAFDSIYLLILGSVIIAVTNDMSTSQDMEYFVWIMAILSITLGSSLRVMLPKLKMVWKGETVVVSKLVSDHHRHKREKRKAQESRKGPCDMDNVTGMDFKGSKSGGVNTASFDNGSFSNETEGYSMMDTLSPLEPRKTVGVLKKERVKEENGLASSSTFDMVDESSIVDDGMMNPPPEQMEKVGEGTGANEEQQSILNYIGASPLAQDDEEVRSTTRLDNLRKKETNGSNFLP